MPRTSSKRPSSTRPRPSGAGGSFSVTDTVQNIGVAAAGASTTQYYLSLDVFRNTADKRLMGSRSVPSLPPGATSTGSVTVTVPGSTASGTYYVLACADDARK